jgi:uncharacterized FlaG/YvyC family protein
MAITTYQVQNILRTYSKQLSRGKRVASKMYTARAEAIADQINISSNVKRRQVINKIAEEIITQLTTAQTTSGTTVNEEALQLLCNEYGKELEVFDIKNGGLRFAVVDKKTGTIVEELNSEESGRLARRLNEITQSIVESNMIS